MAKLPLLVIAGPTASGKTTLAVNCALEFNGEVISADSMQIYKGMNIATAKPTPEEMQGIRHHLMDFLPIDKQYSAADFSRDANKAIQDIHSRNKLPVMAGGTGLYIDSVVNNVKFIETETDYELRDRLNKSFDEFGAEKMLSELSKIDPETAKRLHPSDRKRIIRAFEVYELTGKTVSEQEKESKLEPSPYNTVYIGLKYRNRDILYKRINERVDKMVQNGLLEEAKAYYGLPKKATSSQAIGYKEFKPYFEGEISFREAVENLKKSTRHYAKRQLTWFNKNENIIWFYPDDYESTEELFLKVSEKIKEEI